MLASISVISHFLLDFVLKTRFTITWMVTRPGQKHCPEWEALGNSVSSQKCVSSAGFKP